MTGTPQSVMDKAQVSETLMQQAMSEHPEGEKVAIYAEGQPPADTMDAQPPQATEPPPLPPTSPDLVPRDELDAAQQRYQSLDGMVRAKDAQLDSLRGELDILRTAQAEQPPVQPGRPAHLIHVTDEEAEEYSPENLALYGRVAEGVVDSKLVEMQRRLDQLESEKQQMAASHVNQTFWQAVDGLSEGASRIDSSNDARWVAFLNSPDPRDGVLRRVAGQSYLDNNLAGPMATLVDEFKALHSITDSGVPRNVQTQVHPEVARTHTRPAGTQGQQVPIRRNEITEFYTAKATGEFDAPERKKWAAQREQEIEAAVASGNIV